MEYINFEDSYIHEIRLPIYLKTLRVSEVLESNIIFDIVNQDQLQELNNVEISLDMLDSPKDSSESFHTERNKFVYFKLKNFFHDLPALKYLRLAIEFDEGKSTKRMIDGLSLNTLDSLTGFSFWTNSSGFSFPISYLPPACHTLQLCAFTTFSGQFSDTLNSLKIELNGYGKSFEYFWDRFISPLYNLHCLNIYIADTTEIVDFSYLDFPYQLHTLALVKKKGECKFIFNELPPSMSYILLSCPDMEHRKNVVVFQNVVDETFESIFDFHFKNKVLA
ncbi:unnamed protein product [Ambrosiozyma monospora]|uniref:Unnamed protein product n=1 Tax=Ambrosiozyma monospora TaxID=43982 RepID=A0ACB5T2M0_AMBMO|nr:unnamed protein product [Ambrosiozyma monospora]